MKSPRSLLALFLCLCCAVAHGQEDESAITTGTDVDQHHRQLNCPGNGDKIHTNAWCRNELGPAARPKSSRVCFDTADDCECIPDMSYWNSHTDKCEWKTLPPTTAPVCQPKKTLNFEKYGNNIQTSRGQIAETLWSNIGINIASSSSGKPPMLFDSANPTGGDNDLAHPFHGMILIISEDGDQSDPDDKASGGTLTFTFANPVYIDGLGLMDIEETRGTIKLYSKANAQIGSFPMPTMPDGDSRWLQVNVQNVAKMEVQFQGSGAITDLVYCDSTSMPTGIPTMSPTTKIPTSAPTEMPTLPTPEPKAPTPDMPTWAWGDPHFRTWHGLKEFEFHGGCDLVLMKSKLWDIDIHVRTTIRYDYSYISQTAIRIGEDVFEVGSWGEYMWNDIDGIKFDSGYPVTMGHKAYPITMTQVNKKKRIFTIHIDADKDIEIASMKDYVSVKIENGTKAMFHDAVGMMGDFETGSMLARDGVTHLDDNPDMMGMEWQVRPAEDGDFFAEQRFPIYPVKCEMPTSSVHARRRLGEANDVSLEEAEAACAGWSEGTKAYCVKDVLKTGDLDLALGF